MPALGLDPSVQFSALCFNKVRFQTCSIMMLYDARAEALLVVLIATRTMVLHACHIFRRSSISYGAFLRTKYRKDIQQCFVS